MPTVRKPGSTSIWSLHIWNWFERREDEVADRAYERSERLGEDEVRPGLEVRKLEVTAMIMAVRVQETTRLIQMTTFDAPIAVDDPRR